MSLTVAHPAEIEAQGRKAEFGEHPLDGHNHEILHAPAVCRMGMADHHSPGAASSAQAALDLIAVGVKSDLLLHDGSPDLRIFDDAQDFRSKLLTLPGSHVREEFQILDVMRPSRCNGADQGFRAK